MTNDFTLALEMSFRARYRNVQLTLSQIERRIDLHKEYMKYWTDNWQCFIHWIPLITKINFERWWYHYETPMTFDKWLIFTGHHELAINQYDRPKVATGLFHQQLLNDLIIYKP